MKLTVGEKTITISKWKGKNKKNFVKLLNSDEPNEQKVMDTLVYSCIEEKDVILSTDEFRYVLSKIRALSLGENIDFEFYCEKCKEIFKRRIKISDTIRYTYKDLKEIKIPGAMIKLGPVKNKEMYLNKIAEDPDFDMLFRIESINGNDTFTLNELENIIDDLDIDVLEKVVSIFDEHKFKIDDTNTVTCDCKHEMKFKFDELPDFFPSSWFDEA